MYGSFAFHAWLESAMHIEPIIDPESTKIDTVVMEREFKAAPGERAVRLRFAIDTIKDFTYDVIHENESVGSLGQKILDLLGENGGSMTTGELTTLSGYSRPTVSTECGKLVRLGKIEANKGGGRGKSSTYKIRTSLTT
jgi:predicted HTH transcriptional regulator